ncbi:MAG TPA: iron-sulfur cluster assembly protein [Solirubrobacteraceae bacterium]
MRPPASRAAEAGNGELRERALQALSTVIDPELDEPITELRFVSSCTVSGDGELELRLRLPTPQCAPNFAFLMAADARRVLGRMPGVRGVRVVLEDHYTGQEINAALAGGRGFTGAFPGETDDDDLESLRVLFTRKALTARQSRVCERLLAAGMSADQVVGLHVAELPDDADARRCVQLRAQLGIAADAAAPAFVLADGRPLTTDELDRWRRVGRLVRTSLEANGGICRSLLQVRHGLSSSDEHEEVTR